MFFLGKAILVLLLTSLISLSIRFVGLGFFMFLEQNKIGKLVFSGNNGSSFNCFYNIS